MSTVIRALEFYSGIGGLHYGSILFNHLSKVRHLYEPQAQPTKSPVDVLHPIPKVTWKKHPYNNLMAASSYPNSSNDACHFAEEAAVTSVSSTNDTTGKFIQVLEAFDINTVANDVYEHNFGKRPCTKSISDLTVAELDAYAADMFLMSPPCQPYTRMGLQLDSADARAHSFAHLMETLLPQLRRKPSYILLENVECFETSRSCSMALTQLRSLDYDCQQFLLSPRQFGIPNQRSRFFLLARLRSSPATDAVDSSLPTAANVATDDTMIRRWLPSVHFTPRDQADEALVRVWADPDGNFGQPMCTAPPEEVLAAAEMAGSADAPTLSEATGSRTSAGVLTSGYVPPSRAAVVATETDRADANVDAEADTEAASLSTHSDAVDDSAASLWIPATVPARLRNFLEDYTDLSAVSSRAMREHVAATRSASVNIAAAVVAPTATTQPTTTATSNDSSATSHSSAVAAPTPTSARLSKAEKRALKQAAKEARRQVAGGQSIALGLPGNPITVEKLLLSAAALSKRSSWCIDLSDADSVNTRCFTKGYATFLNGTGSMLQTYDPARHTLPSAAAADRFSPARYQTAELPASAPYKALMGEPAAPCDAGVYLDLMAPLAARGVRYFHPREIANLHFFPPPYQPVPEPKTAVAQAGKRKTADDVVEEETEAAAMESDGAASTAATTPFKRKAGRADDGRQVALPTATAHANLAARCGEHYACFSFPPTVSLKQQLRLLGNSLNVYVVAQLLLHLIQ